MLPLHLHNRREIAAFLRHDPYLHLYALGDLDDFFWPYTTWYASRSEGKINALLLLYSGAGLPVVLAIAQPGPDLGHLRALLEASLHLLPRRFYTHLTPGLAGLLANNYRLEAHGRYLKMALSDPSKLGQVDISGVVPFGPTDADELCRFYAESYPGNWFDPRMLETGHYYGLREAGELVSVAGVHVYSPTQRAAALGNIVTHPAARGRGYATVVTARLCRELLTTVDQVGLNVHAENTAAIACYHRLGFVHYASFEELELTLAG